MALCRADKQPGELRRFPLLGGLPSDDPPQAGREPLRGLDLNHVSGLHPDAKRSDTAAASVHSAGDPAATSCRGIHHEGRHLWPTARDTAPVPDQSHAPRDAHSCLSRPVARGCDRACKLRPADCCSHPGLHGVIEDIRLRFRDQRLHGTVFGTNCSPRSALRSTQGWARDVCYLVFGEC